jgi:hypothetical protein
MSHENQPSELTDVFIHNEAGEEVAFFRGKEIARRTRSAQARFYAELHVWRRKTHFQGRFWRIAETGDAQPATDVEEASAHAFDPA